MQDAQACPDSQSCREPSYALPIRASPQTRQLDRIRTRSPSLNNSREKEPDVANSVDITFTYSDKVRLCHSSGLFNIDLLWILGWPFRYGGVVHVLAIAGVLVDLGLNVESRIHEVRVAGFELHIAELTDSYDYRKITLHDSQVSFRHPPSLRRLNRRSRGLSFSGTSEVCS
jgi:hypothetical protein